MEPHAFERIWLLSTDIGRTYYDNLVVARCPTVCPDVDGDGKVTICHRPPGDLDNEHTITISVHAVPAHLAHGDSCGPCESDGSAAMSFVPVTDESASFTTETQ